MKRQFDEIIETLKVSVADYKYYTNFEKVFRNVEKFNVELNVLNSLIGSKNIEKDFEELLVEYPKVLKVIPLLLAIRKLEVPIIDGKPIIYDFKTLSLEVSEYSKFMRETGLFSLLENNKIKSLVDYTIGVEVGLDTNARKNRTGTSMENIVESFIEKEEVEYLKEANKKRIKNEFGISLDSLIVNEDQRKDAEKRFDFAIFKNNQLLLIETNFYGSGGSKLNETARSYKSLAKDIKNIENVQFLWITDGVGWKTAKNNLEETYNEMEHLYTIFDLENGILSEILG